MNFSCAALIEKDSTLTHLSDESTIGYSNLHRNLVAFSPSKSLIEVTPSPAKLNSLIVVRVISKNIFGSFFTVPGQNLSKPLVLLPL